MGLTFADELGSRVAPVAVFPDRERLVHTPEAPLNATLPADVWEAAPPHRLGKKSTASASDAVTAFTSRGFALAGAKLSTANLISTNSNLVMWNRL